MARSKLTWFPFEQRSWLESERVLRMPLAAQGVYIRALCYQAIHGSLPSDDTLAFRLQIMDSSFGDLWKHVSPHFDLIDLDGEQRLINAKLDEAIEALTGKNQSQARFGNKNATKTPLKRQRRKRHTHAEGDAASLSLSPSLSPSLSVLKDEKVAPENSETPEPKQPEKPKRKKRESELPVRLVESFSAFWAAYPKKVGPGAAEKAWMKIDPSPELLARILAAITAQKQSDKWRRGFIKDPVNWLNEKCWLDEIEAATRPQSYGQANQFGFATERDLTDYDEETGE